MQILSGNSKTDTVTVKRTTIDYAKWALSELKANEALVKSLEAENKLLTERLTTEQEKTDLLTELSAARKKEAEFWQSANTENKNVIALKDDQIKNNLAEIDILKRKKTSLIDKARFIGIGIAIGATARSLF